MERALSARSRAQTVFFVVKMVTPWEVLQTDKGSLSLLSIEEAQSRRDESLKIIERFVCVGLVV
jgi:hypothetical protein